jgi:methylated-DNA-[protein]-cysteine S-methyltransferase
MTTGSKRESFSEKVYNLCREIPPGKVTTYREMAEVMGTRAYQAIGQALKKNKSSDIPCHRVVMSTGEAGGYHGRNEKKIKEKIEKLKREGVVSIRGRINLNRYRFTLRTENGKGGKT